jgi:hypothetical protein
MSVEHLLFHGTDAHYGRAFIMQDYGTISLGEGALGITTTSNYKRDVLVMTVEQDIVFCGALAGPGDCGASGILQETGELYPAARNYSWFAVDIAGSISLVVRRGLGLCIGGLRGGTEY